VRSFTVIAHRGASGYLPEHTLEGAVLAHAMGADYIELDVVLTRDDVPIVLHDLWLDAVTDVAERFPGRQRPDGRHYALDFSWQEIRELRAHERVRADGSPAFPGRFPPAARLFRVPALEDMIQLIQGLNRTTGREAGLYIEPKSPGFHAAAGRDPLTAVIRMLAAYGLSRRFDPVCLQSFDPAALRRARHELRTDLNLVQLIGENAWGAEEWGDDYSAAAATDFDALGTEAGLAMIAEFADGIGPWLPQVVGFEASGTPRISGLAAAAHRHGLFVHAWTLQADRLPAPVPDLGAALDVLIHEAGLDGVFTDHPDRVRKAAAATRIPPEEILTHRDADRR
jgi:glycerophosphoryl diester phosphodiesterase